MRNFPTGPDPCCFSSYQEFFLQSVGPRVARDTFISSCATALGYKVCKFTFNSIVVFIYSEFAYSNLQYSRIW